MKLGVDKVYVLHVKRGYEERENSIKRQSRQHDFDFEFVLDWDVEDLDDSTLSKFFPSDSGLTLPQKSLCLKHYQALKQISDLDTGLIFEDDVILGRDFSNRFRECLEESKTLKGDFILCIGSGCNLFTPRQELQKTKKLYLASQMRAADSYVVSGSVARTIVEHIEECGFHLPYDHFLESILEGIGVSVYWLEPPIVVQGSQNGTFQTALYKKKPLLYKRLHWAFERLRRQYLQAWRTQ